MLTLKALTSCAVLCAVTVVVSRIMSLVPNEASRYSIEAVPIFLSGLLFGPIAGSFVGFASDFIGCMFSPFGYNPIFSLPPILYGLSAGIFAGYIKKSSSALRIAIAFAVPIILGSVLWQSFALSLIYGGGAKTEYFTAKLIERGIQFGVMWIIDTLLVWMLLKSKVLAGTGVLKIGKGKKR